MSLDTRLFHLKTGMLILGHITEVAPRMNVTDALIFSVKTVDGVSQAVFQEVRPFSATPLFRDIAIADDQLLVRPYPPQDSLVKLYESALRQGYGPVKTAPVADSPFVKR